MQKSEGKSCLNVGSKLILNYEKDGAVYSKKVKLVSKNFVDKIPPRIEVGCIIGAFRESQIFEFESLEKEKIILLEDDVLDYVVL